MFEKLFQKKKEDFVCEKCGTRVLGNGYTNHCPHCLWSKHVDHNPGDRAATCGGEMEPKEIEQKGKGFVLTHVCTECGHKKKNKMCSQDNFDKAVEIVKKTQD